MPSKVEVHDCCFCHIVVGEDQHCEGCGEYVCENCDTENMMATYRHDVNEHREHEHDVEEDD